MLLPTTATIVRVLCDDDHMCLDVFFPFTVSSKTVSVITLRANVSLNAISPRPSLLSSLRMKIISTHVIY